MKKSFLIVIILLTVLPNVYAKHKKKHPKNSIQSILVWRTPCFGRCPTYKIEVNKNGIVTYTGIMFIKDSGVYQKNIGVVKATQIIKQFSDYKIDTCQDQYPMMIPDAPGLIFKIQYKDSTKTINNAHYGPPFLKDLAKSVDSIGKVDNSWEKIAGKTTLH
ncbi:MAG TPA: DUF6438 domain-containing protein [Flavipsychrobacter sp.]|nr:DUF6438 domain-containing protein [Flavipsychrobacter sp.]